MSIFVVHCFSVVFLEAFFRFVVKHGRQMARPLLTSSSWRRVVPVAWPSNPAPLPIADHVLTIRLLMLGTRGSIPGNCWIISMTMCGYV